MFVRDSGERISVRRRVGDVRARRDMFVSTLAAYKAVLKAPWRVDFTT